jgi:hypothetical protein
MEDKRKLQFHICPVLPVCDLGPWGGCAESMVTLILEMRNNKGRGRENIQDRQKERVLYKETHNERKLLAGP